MLISQVRFYYQHNPARVATCPLTIHALLHISDGIKAAGPVWAYWAFPMERYCGTLLPAVKSRRFPFASLDQFVADHAQLNQVKLLYNLHQKLSLRGPVQAIVGEYSNETCRCSYCLPFCPTY